MIDRKDWPEDARNAQAAFDEASWDAVEGYRDTGEMVPGMKDGKLYLYTVDEALRTMDSCRSSCCIHRANIAIH